MASHRAPEIEIVESTGSDAFFDWQGLEKALWCWAVGIVVLGLLASTLGTSDQEPAQRATTPGVAR